MSRSTRLILMLVGLTVPPIGLLAAVILMTTKQETDGKRVLLATIVGGIGWGLCWYFWPILMGPPAPYIYPLF